MHRWVPTARRVAIRLAFSLTLLSSAMVAPVTPSAAQVLPNSLSGTANCPGDGRTVLPGATVQVLSGTTQVASTTADGNGAFQFSPVAPNATFGIRYTQVSPGTLSCGTTVVTNPFGNTTVPDPGPCPNIPGGERNNHAWDNAFDITKGTAAGQFGFQTTDYICKANESIWLQLPQVSSSAVPPIGLGQPGQIISVTVAGGTSQTRVALFKNLNKEKDTLVKQLSAPAVQQDTASMNGPESAPWDSSPWDSSPWDSSPWDSSPWDSSPWDSSPWDSSPWDSSPWDSSGLCPTIASNVCSGIYSAAEMRGLMAFSSQGSISKNTFDQSGPFFIRVYNQDASFDPTQPLTITVSVAGNCGTPPQGTNVPAIQKTSSSFLSADGQSTSLPGGKTTLIFTNTARLIGSSGAPLNDPSNSADLTSFQTTVNNFAASSLVNGVVVDFANTAWPGPSDVSNDAGVQKDYSQWDSVPSCPTAANLLSESIHDLVNGYRLQSGGSFQYVTILGGHTVLPYRLQPDRASLQQEKRYDPGLLDLSKSAASLAFNYVMTDNYYVSFNPISRQDAEINLPDANLAVGRLVESPTDIATVLNTFLDPSLNGAVRPKAALVTGYTFMADLSRFEAGQFMQTGLTDTDSQLICDKCFNDVDTSNTDRAWSMPQLTGKLFDPARNGTTKPTFGLLALNWHAESNEAVAADYESNHPSIIKSADIANWTTDQRFRNTLVLSIGCHYGDPLLDPDVIPTPGQTPPFVTDTRGFPEAFASQGAMLLGNSGYGYGDTVTLAGTERLLANFTQQLGTGSAGTPIPVGIALANAKRAYANGVPALTGIDEKVVEELTFYGPPMWGVDLPVRALQAPPNSLTLTGIRGFGDSGLSTGVASPPYQLTDNTINSGDFTFHYFQADPDGPVPEGWTAPASWFLPYPRETYADPFRPTVPLKTYQPSNPPSGTARGVALLQADYVDEFGDVLISPPITESCNTGTFINTSRTNCSPPPTETFVSHGFTPGRFFGLNELTGQSVFVSPFQWQSNNGSSGTMRTYPNPANDNLRLYYSGGFALSSGAILAGPASIRDVSITPNGSLAHVDVTVSGSTLAGLNDVLVTYTVTPPTGATGHWVTCSLARTDTSVTPNISECPNAASSFTFLNGDTFVQHFFGDIDPSNPLFPSGSAATSLQMMIQAATNTGLVSTRTNNGRYFSLVPPTATLTNPKAVTTLQLTTTPAFCDDGQSYSLPSSGPYDHFAGFSAQLSPASGPVTTQPTITFALGSQRVTVPTFNGTASGCILVSELPSNYSIVATFAETADLLGSSATAPFKVNKKATHLAFGTHPNGTTNPFQAILTDGDGNLLREETVYFTISGNGLSAPVTLAARTGANGAADLHGAALAAGTYNVQVSFPGTIPVDSTVRLSTCSGKSNCSIQLTDERYQSSSNSVALTADVTPPSCAITRIGTDANMHRFIQVTVQDTASGIASVDSTTLLNATLSIPSYVAGVTDPLVITATQQVSGSAMRVMLRVTDMAGNITNCDPWLFSVGSEPGVERSETVTHLAQGEGKVTIYNQTPGLTRLRLTVDRKVVQVKDLEDGETRVVDLSGLMRKGNNTIAVTAEGKSEGSALVMISDSSSVADKVKKPKR